MKKTLLLFSLCASMLGFKAQAQEPATINIYNNAVYYGMYDQLQEAAALPEGAIRNKNWSYGKKLTEDQIAAIGNKLTINVTAEALCDDYDRIGNVNLAFVPKGATSYVYENVERIEIGRFITPFMNNITKTPSQVPYTFSANNIAKILHDVTISAEYDFWIELEIYGHQGGESADQGGAQWDFLVTGLCHDRNDVYKGSLDLVTENDPDSEESDLNYLDILSYKYELKDYTLDGTDVLGQTVRTINFTLDEAVPNAKFYLITSNHGSNYGGEEYKNREHNVYLDNALVHTYKPGQYCEPFRVYNTMGNGVYGPSPRTMAYWLSRAWCPGAAIAIRDIELGDLTAGEHSFKIDVPDATFAGNQGYFPMSVYLQGYDTTTLATKKINTATFSIAPNPVTDVATIAAKGQEVKSVAVVNTLGQTVWNGTTNKVDLSALKTGIYMVNVAFANGQTAAKKVVKN